jgi:hypothetical protein
MLDTALINTLVVQVANLNHHGTDSHQNSRKDCRGDQQFNNCETLL